MGAEGVMFDAFSLQLPLYDPAAAGLDAAYSLISEVRAADGLIIASPGYHGGPSGLVKNALDYLEELRTDERPYLEGRAVGCIVCAAGWQATTTALMSLRATIHALRGWPTPLGVAINSLEAPFGPDGFASAEIQLRLKTVGRQVVEFARSRDRSPSLASALSFPTTDVANTADWW
jgi:FMN reductase